MGRFQYNGTGRLLLGPTFSHHQPRVVWAGSCPKRGRWVAVTGAVSRLPAALAVAPSAAREALRRVGTLRTPQPNPCPECVTGHRGVTQFGQHNPRPARCPWGHSPLAGDVSSWAALSRDSLQSPAGCAALSGHGATFSPGEPSAAGTPKCGTAGGGDKRWPCRGAAQTPPGWEWWEVGATSKARGDEHRGLGWCQWHRGQGWGSRGRAVPCCHTAWDMDATLGKCAGPQTGEGPAAGTGI